MTTLEMFTQVEEALQSIGLSMDDFYAVERSATGLRVQGKYSEKIVKALTPDQLTINKYAGWVESIIDPKGINLRIILTW